MTYGETRTEELRLIDAECVENVQRGIELLDKEYGPNWVEKIDLDTFNICEYDYCVLGQLYEAAEPTTEQLRVYFARRYGDPDMFYSLENGFARGRAIVDGELLTDAGVVKHGFDASVGASDEVYRVLQDRWQAEIERLQLERAKAAHR